MVHPVRSSGWHSMWIPNRRRSDSDQQALVVAFVCAGDRIVFVSGLGCDVLAGRCETLVVRESDAMGRYESDSDSLYELSGSWHVSVSFADGTDEHALRLPAGKYVGGGNVVGRRLVFACETDLSEDVAARCVELIVYNRNQTEND